MIALRTTAVAVTLVVTSTSFAQTQAASVAVSEVQLKETAAGQVYVGTITPSRWSSVGAAVDGRVSEIHVDEGDFVKKLMPLAQLLTETITLERDAAQAELDLRQQELKELENGARPEELDEARARMLAAKAFEDFRLAQRHRNQKLFEDKAIGIDALHEVEAETDAAIQLHRQADATFRLVIAGPRSERILQAQARVARQNAIVRNLESRIRKHTIIAPFDGYVVTRPAELGEWISQGDLVADVLALGEVDVLVNVLEKHVAHMDRGVEVRVDIPAMPDQLFTGQVVQIVPQADVRARTFPVKVRIKNTLLPGGPLIKSGMLARAMLPTGAKLESLLVPKDALVLGGPSPVVFVVDAVAAGKGKARPVPVTLGVAVGRLIAVTGVLKAGEQVVVRGNERLRPGQDVVITEVLDPNSEPRAKATGS